MKITNLGTDPEFFLVSNQEFKSSIPIVGMGTKEVPMPMDKDGFYFLHDNVAVEFNVPPAKTLEEFTANIKHGLKYIRHIIPDNYDISTEASAFFNELELLDMRALEFGCTPSFNAWQNAKEMPRPEATDSNLRSCGGHIHIEVDDLSYKSMISFIKALDLHLAVPSVLMDTDLHRRSLYGKAGDFRDKLKDNRFEYRTLSNFWIFDDALISWVWKNVDKALEYVKTEGEIKDDSKLASDIQKAINTSDYSLAASISKAMNLDVSPIPVNTILI